MNAEHYWVKAPVLFLITLNVLSASLKDREMWKTFNLKSEYRLYAILPLKETHLMAALSRKLSCGITRVSGDDRYRSNWTCHLGLGGGGGVYRRPGVKPFK